jgi:hypothetical protein
MKTMVLLQVNSEKCNAPYHVTAVPGLVAVRSSFWGAGYPGWMIVHLPTGLQAYRNDLRTLAEAKAAVKRLAAAQADKPTKIDWLMVEKIRNTDGPGYRDKTRDDLVAEIYACLGGHKQWLEVLSGQPCHYY